MVWLRLYLGQGFETFSKKRKKVILRGVKRYFSFSRPILDGSVNFHLYSLPVLRRTYCNSPTSSLWRLLYKE